MLASKMHFWPDLGRIPTCPNSGKTWAKPSGCSVLQGAYVVEIMGGEYLSCFTASTFDSLPFPVLFFPFLGPFLFLLCSTCLILLPLLSISIYSCDFSCTSYGFFLLFPLSFSSFSTRVMKHELWKQNTGTRLHSISTTVLSMCYWACLRAFLCPSFPICHGKTLKSSTSRVKQDNVMHSAPAGPLELTAVM